MDEQIKALHEKIDKLQAAVDRMSERIWQIDSASGNMSTASHIERFVGGWRGKSVLSTHGRYEQARAINTASHTDMIQGWPLHGATISPSYGATIAHSDGATTT